MSCIRIVSLIVNCGYARTTIYENSKRSSDSATPMTINREQRIRAFRSQFSSCTNFGIPDGYFDPKGKEDLSQFDRDCEKVVQAFKSKWPSGFNIHKEEYLTKFSNTKWSELPNPEKNRHTLSNCTKCHESYYTYQRAFPLKPLYQPSPVVQIDRDALQQQGVKKFTTKVLAEINNVYEEEAGTSFRDAIVKDKTIKLEKKKSKYENRKEKRRVQKQFTQTVNKCFAEKAAITFLAEGESKRKYHRKRLAQSFDTPENCQAPPPKRQKSHSPNFENVQWDTDKLEATLRNWPTGTPINWSAIANDHNIPGGNGGQVVQEFAKKRGIDNVFQGSTPNRKQRTRSSKKKLSGSGVSIPSNPPISIVEKEIESMVKSGRFTLGEECAPYKIVKYAPVNGKLTPQETIVMARKIPLIEIRKRLLEKQRKYMRLTPDSNIRALAGTELKERLDNIGCSTTTKTHEQLCTALASYERTRFLALLHDHATILKMGFIMITVHTLYDSAVFLTDEEYQQQNPHHQGVCLQSEIEQPEIYLLSLGGSSVEDQSALIGDRIDCLSNLNNPIDAGNGIMILDNIRMFTGDHPAAQFEQGTKLGGNYKCACGCRESLFDDQAHALQHKWRQLSELQSLATQGVYGKQAGVIRPFEALKVDELRQELSYRGVLDTSMTKPVLQEMLEQQLRGVASVPALLLTNPTQSLLSLNIDRYEVVASEPLHDLKGHIINLLTELPHVLPPGDVTTQCNHLISCCLAKEKKSGADLRRAVIQVFLLLKDLDCGSTVLILLQTIIKIGEILYSRDAQRSPRQLLQLYNQCWLHMELCTTLFAQPKKLSRTKMFGHYLHALTAHSPEQYELVCQRSINTENQERLFGQARVIAEMCTNHHANNVIPQVLLRLQAKQENRAALLSVEKADTQVGQVAKHLSHLPGTTIKCSYISQRERQWQAHLKRISPFLVHGKGVWWVHADGGFHFLDGDKDVSHKVGPTLLHFRQHTLNDVHMRREECWEKLIDKRIPIPAKTIRIYNKEGNLEGKLIYGEDLPVYEPNNPAVTSTQDACPQPDTVLSDTLKGIDQVSPTTLSLSSCVSAAPSETGKGTSQMETIGGTGIDPQATHPLTHTPKENAEMLFKDLTDTIHPLVSEGSPPAHISTSDTPQPSSSSNRASSSATPKSLKKSHIVIEMEPTQTQGLKTSLGASLVKVIGYDTTVQAFDELRSKLKQLKRAKADKRKEIIERYKHLSSLLSARVLAKRTQLDAHIRDLEHEHFIAHGRVPDHDNESYAHSVSVRNSAKAVLRNLNVDL